MTRKLILASGNQGKVAELQHLLRDCGFEILPQTTLDVPEVEETGLTFVENAILKARNASCHTRLPAIADDSGLEVDFLQGQPGIYSSRFAGSNASDADNNAHLLELLRNADDDQRHARFQCVLVFLRHENDPAPIICQGTWEGRILREPRGKQGFGYDPLFWSADTGCSAAELNRDTKARRSHRGKAMQGLRAALLAEFAHS